MDRAEFDRFADAYYEQHRENVAVTGEGPEYFAEYKIKQLRQIVERERIDVSRICDFGSGIGNSIPFFRQYFPAASLTSSDVSERSLALSRQRYPGAGDCVLIEDSRIPCEADSFDVVFSACVFHHIPHDESVRRERPVDLRTQPGEAIERRRMDVAPHPVQSVLPARVGPAAAARSEPRLASAGCAIRGICAQGLAAALRGFRLAATPCSGGMGTCRFPMPKPLADATAFGHIPWQVVHSGRPMFSGRGENPHRR
jgi:SAM-dependent methyltransferase